MFVRATALLGPALVLFFTQVLSAQLGFQAPSTTVLASGASPTAIAAGDVNGDYLDDVILACSGTQELQIHAAVASGGFTLLASIPVSGDMTDLLIQDLDGDGDLDMVTVDDLLGEIRSFWNDGSANFIASPPISLPGASRVEAADFNGDLLHDLVVVDGAGLAYFLDAAGGLGSTPASSLGSFSAEDLTVADLDQDGKLDLAFLVSAPATGLVTLFGDGLGAFTTAPQLNTSGSFPRAIQAGDLDLDGDVDLVLAFFLPANTIVLTNDGSGSFSPTVANAGVHLTDALLNDVDADEDLDLVVLDVAFDSIWVAENNGGTLLPAIQLATGSFPGEIALGDFDGDYHQDILSFSETDGSFSVYTNLCDLPRLEGPAAIGTVGIAGGATQAETVILIDNEAGGPYHRVERGLSTLIFIDVVQPMSTMVPAYFALWGRLGTPLRNEIYDLPLGLGTMAFVPHPAATMSPAHFTVTNNLYADPLQLAGSFPAPWNVAFLSPGTPAQVTFQGLIIDAPGQLSVTNAVIVDIR